MMPNLRCFILLICLIATRVLSEETECMASGECAMNEAVITSDGSDVAASIDNNDDPSCPSRNYVIKCAGEHLDTNNNGLLERAELQAAIDALPWFSRGIISILGSVDKMMKKCDLDGDGAISIDYDMRNNGETCLATCFKRLAFKKAFFPDCS